MVSIWKDFADFAFQGNVIDLSVGIIIGGAFGKIVNALVNDIVMPPIGWLLSGVDFANLFILLKRGKKNSITKTPYKSLSHARDDGAVTVNIGIFLNTILNFIVVSGIIFTVVRTINNLKRETTSKKAMKIVKCPYCFKKIDHRASRCPYCTSLLPSTKKDTHKEASLSDNLPAAQSKEDIGLMAMEDDEATIEKEERKVLKKNLKKQFSQSFSNLSM